MCSIHRSSFIPESFRWLVARNKIKDARSVVDQVARLNRRPVNDFDLMVRSVENHLTGEEDRKYSLLVLFRKRSMLKLTVPLIIVWFVRSSKFILINEMLLLKLTAILPVLC